MKNCELISVGLVKFLIIDKAQGGYSAHKLTGGPGLQKKKLPLKKYLNIGKNTCPINQPKKIPDM